MATALAVLDTLRERAEIDEAAIPRAFGRISFFVNAGIRFIEEMCKVRAMTQIWDRLGRERYGVEDPKLRRFRYGVQVNSLGLTEAQPENNVIRIVLEALEFRRPAKTSTYLEIIIDNFRKVVPFIKDDRILHFDIKKAEEFIKKTII